ncbi:uncharacterized protein LOC124380414 isoform X2 [Silurus meridionalis]|uniref:Uncharacterized protein n=1 Tax=Silurus meridionalis TaxID=175797 RepID=A0A8T0BP51_SILME|nr:uncharacterized protein LOC124380414 isoform X2 [Silurus meridionalis]KAF7709131.1 hypothetical protein HF521_015981 [Silurus meridionalis]
MDSASGSSTETVNTVWVAFMDNIPVVSPSKELVELALALRYGNTELIIEKEKAFNNFSKNEYNKKYNKEKYVPPTEPMPGVVEIREEDCDEYVRKMKVSKQALQQTPPE